MTEWWGAVSRAAGGKKFDTFYQRYVDGREPFPWDSLLPLAGLRVRSDTIREARLGISTADDSAGRARVTDVAPTGAGAAAGLQPGDVLLALGDTPIANENSFAQFRAAYATRDGEPLPIRIQREGKDTTLAGTVRLVARVEQHIEADANAAPRAARVRHGLFAGVTEK